MFSLPGNSNKQESLNTPSFTEEEARAAQRALVSRPGISIRLRIALGFLLTFIMNAAFIVAGILFIAYITKQQDLLEYAGNFEFEIQQARRFEKNYFLYGTNLYDALNNAQNARNQLHDFEAELRRLVGDRAYENMADNLARYLELLERLRSLNGEDKEAEAEKKLAVESELRNFGAAIVANASNAIDQERLVPKGSRGSSEISDNLFSKMEFYWIIRNEIVHLIKFRFYEWFQQKDPSVPPLHWTGS